MRWRIGSTAISVGFHEAHQSLAGPDDSVDFDRRTSRVTGPKFQPPNLGVRRTEPFASPNGAWVNAGSGIEPSASTGGAAVNRRDALVILGAFVLGYGIDAAWARAVRGVRLEREEYPKLTVGRFRIHHNVLGYALILVGFWMYPVFLIPLGLGVIVGHRIRDRLFWFVEVIEPAVNSAPAASAPRRN